MIKKKKEKRKKEKKMKERLIIFIAKMKKLRYTEKLENLVSVKARVLRGNRKYNLLPSEPTPVPSPFDSPSLFSHCCYRQ